MPLDCALRFLVIAVVLAGGVSAQTAASSFTPPRPDDCPLLQDRGHGDGTLIHGDIIVPPEYFADAAFTTQLWQDGLIRYFVEDSVTASNLQRIEAAMAEWESVANVDFARWYEHSAYHVHIRQADPEEDNFSGTGRGTYDIGITHWENHGVLLHELGHCLGYWHEQERPDRDAYVRIVWSNIESGEEHNFEIESLASTRAPYDFASIMHYQACLFSEWGTCSTATPWAWTIEALPPYVEWQGTMGTLNVLSTIDRVAMSFMYAPDYWRFVDPRSRLPVDGSFLRPYTTLANGLAGVPTGGTLVLEGSYAAVGVYTKPMTLRAQFKDAVLH